MQAEIARLKVVEEKYQEEMARREIEVEVAIDVEDEEQEKEQQRAIKVLNGMIKNRNWIISDLRKESEESQVAIKMATAESKAKDHQIK